MSCRRPLWRRWWSACRCDIRFWWGAVGWEGGVMNSQQGIHMIRDRVCQGDTSHHVVSRNTPASWTSDKIEPVRNTS